MSLKTWSNRLRLTVSSQKKMFFCLWKKKLYLSVKKYRIFYHQGTRSVGSLWILHDISVAVCMPERPVDDWIGYSFVQGGYRSTCSVVIELQGKWTNRWNLQNDYWLLCFPLFYSWRGLGRVSTSRTKYKAHYRIFLIGNENTSASSMKFGTKQVTKAEQELRCPLSLTFYLQLGRSGTRQPWEQKYFIRQVTGLGNVGTYTWAIC